MSKIFIRLPRAIIERLIRQLPAVPPRELNLVTTAVTEPLLVMRKGRRIAHAWIHASGPRHPDAACHLRGVPEIFDVAVSWPYRSRGVGSWLLTQLHARLAAQGHTRCCVGVWQSNTRAARLYEALGYQRVEGVIYFDEFDQGNGSTSQRREPADLYVKDLAH